MKAATRKTHLVDGCVSWACRRCGAEFPVSKVKGPPCPHCTGKRRKPTSDGKRRVAKNATETA